MAAAGMMLGHWLSYLIAVPNMGLRSRLLADSGHSYWVIAVQLSVGSLALGLGALAVRSLLGREPGSSHGRIPRLTVQLVGLQVSLFTVVEVAERLGAGEPVAHMFHHRLFVVGLAVQCLVALAGAAFLGWFGRAAVRVTLAARATWVPRLAFTRFASFPSPMRPVLILRGGAGLRSPPPR
jgi:hypothetical protein